MKGPVMRWAVVVSALYASAAMADTRERTSPRSVRGSLLPPPAASTGLVRVPKGGAPPSCPGCSVVVTPRPRRTRRCEDCGAVYKVRSNEWFFPSSLLFDWQATVSDTLAKNFHDPEVLRAMRDVVHANARDHRACVIALSPIVPAFVAVPLLYSLDRAHGDEALRAKLRADLERIADPNGIAGDVQVVATTAHRTCQACATHHRHRYAISEALATNPLPCRGCTCWELNQDDAVARRFCQCTYSPVFYQPEAFGDFGGVGELNRLGAA